MDTWRDMRRMLDEMAAADLLRNPVTVQSPPGPTVRIDGREVVCLCSNDYLSLAADPAVKAATIDAVRQWGVGAGASRLVSGTTPLHVQLEQAIASFKGTEAAAVTPTGWMANRAAVCALVGKGDLVVGDKLNHASIIDAARASGATFRTYPHGDLPRMEQLLDRRRGRFGRCLIATDSLFSMDGDLAPLSELADLKDRFDAQLLIDDAHATGVLGAGGRGAAELLGVEDRIDVVVGTLSKAMGSLGGFVAGPQVLVDAVRNTARAYIYTTAPPPALCAAALAAIQIIQAQPQRRIRLLALAARLRKKLAAAGIDSGRSVSQIMPVHVGDAGCALRTGAALLKAGFLAVAIRPPTVPKGTSRLRVSLCCTHTAADVDGFVEAILECGLRKPLSTCDDGTP